MLPPGLRLDYLPYPQNYKLEALSCGMERELSSCASGQRRESRRRETSFVVCICRSSCGKIVRGNQNRKEEIETYGQ